MTGTAESAGTLVDAVLDVAGARIHFDVRGTGPLLVLVGSPMGADGFAASAALLAADHTVVTFDPRGTGRSPVDDVDADSPVPVRAADLAALVEHLGRGPATLVGSSGGAVVSLALMQTRPELVRAVVAHEPPLQELLPDAAARRETTDEMVRRYHEQGPAAAWALFMEAANLPAGGPDGPGDPTADGPGDAGATGLPGADDPDPGRERQDADERHFFLHEMRETVRWSPDLDILRGRRVAVGIGEDSDGQLCDLTSRALATGLGITPERFPGGHVGFMEQPEAFDARLRDVLARL
ncbi:alpha/beta hydrolase [Pseudonocardia sp. NPDC049635]|uniref:alpha/beta fold hydrolase n=1 Tax=Pseudonocardia sp. NPDC049635 TaxID=3155506 RepID=UPI0034105055